jgi:hypothetical protein
MIPFSFDDISGIYILFPAFWWPLKPCQHLIIKKRSSRFCEMSVVIVTVAIWVSAKVIGYSLDP